MMVTVKRLPGGAGLGLLVERVMVDPVLWGGPTAMVPAEVPDVPRSWWLGAVVSVTTSRWHPERWSPWPV